MAKIELVTKKIVTPVKALVPIDWHGEEEIDKLKDGKEVYTTLEQSIPATVNQYKLAWGIARAIHRNIGFFTSDRHALDFMLQNFGHMQKWTDPITGREKTAAVSLRDLNRSELSAFIDNMFHYVVTELAPGLSTDTLVREVMKMVSRN